MRKKRNKAISTVISGLLATTIVTACVKNGSKDEDPNTQGLKNFEASALSGNELNGIVPIQFVEDSDIASAKMIKEYSFELNEVREFRVSQGAINNDECRTGDSFIYSFSLIDSSGQERPIHAKRNPELLAPGAYRLRLEIDNGSLCRKVSMEINIRSKVRSDLTMTKKEDRGYQCHNVEENGAIQSRTSVRINTSPMRVVKFQTIQGATREQVIVDENTLCSRKLKENTQCIDQLNPASVEDRPLSANKRECRSNNEQSDQRVLGQAILQVNRAQERHAEFSCRHRRKVISFELGNCDLLFNLGQKMPLQTGFTKIVIRRDRMRVNFDLTEGTMDENHLPRFLYVGVLIKRDNSYYEPVSDSFTEIRKADLLDGQFTIRDENIRRKVMALGVENIHVIVSERPNMRRGLYSFSMNEVCSHPENSVIEKKAGEATNLCE